MYLPWQRYGTPDEVRAFYAGRVGDERVGQLGHRDAAVLRDDGNPHRERARFRVHRHRRCAARGDRERERRRARYWPGEEPIGKRVRISPRFEWATVVGVAADLRCRELTNHWMTVYFPAPQSFHFQPGNLAIRTARPPSTLLSAVRDTIRAVEPSIPIDTLTPMDALLAAELARPRLAVRISIAFGLVTLALIAVGLFATVSFDAGQRRFELAIRSALGASPHALRRLVAGRGLRIAAAGVVTGLAATALEPAPWPRSCSASRRSIRSRWRRSPAGWRCRPSWPAGSPPDGRRPPTPRRRFEAASERRTRAAWAALFQTLMSGVALTPTS